MEGCILLGVIRDQANMDQLSRIYPDQRSLMITFHGNHASAQAATGYHRRACGLRQGCKRRTRHL